MTATSLPARIVYAAITFPLGAAAGFYLCREMLGRFAALLPSALSDLDEFSAFRMTVLVAGTLAITLSLIALTLPWKRRRKRRGRAGRAIVGAAVLLLLSLVYAGRDHALVYDLALTVWLAYLIFYTFVRYGVLDQARRTSPRTTPLEGE